MLLRAAEDGALAIGQLSHAWLSGQLARAWGNERFPAPEPREEIALGAELHDIGWALFDLEPPFDPETGLPQAFTRTSVERHLEIWRTAPERLLSASALAALVVSLHGSALSELRARAVPSDASVLRGHIETEHARQQQLRELLGLSAGDTRRIQRQMWAWDSLSLALCHRWQPFVVRDVPAGAGLAEIELRDLGEDRWTIEPWPFAADRVELRCECRPLAPRYDGEAQMRAALAGARPATLAFSLLAAADGAS